MEGFFAKLTRRRLKHGVFRSVIDLQGAINRFVAEHNEEEAKPFIWRADPDAIIAARNRGFQALESNHYHLHLPDISPLAAMNKVCGRYIVSMHYWVLFFQIHFLFETLQKPLFIIVVRRHMRILVSPMHRLSPGRGGFRAG